MGTRNRPAVAEVLDVTPANIDRMSDGTHHNLEIIAGKDTTGEYSEGKQRETWLPVDLEGLIYRYADDNDIDDDPLIDKSKKTLQNWVDNAAERAAERTGDDDYQRVSSHDLRRCWAHHLLVEEGVSPRIVMALGGWSSYDAIEPYLAAPSEDNIIESMSQVSL
jgi:integrase